jgi:hypothetical protein
MRRLLRRMLSPTILLGHLHLTHIQLYETFDLRILFILLAISSIIHTTTSSKKMARKVKKAERISKCELSSYLKDA